MKETKISFYFTTAISLALIGIGFLVAGCAATGPREVKQSARSEQQSADQSEAPDQGAARLWAQNCSSCHSLKEPGTYNDAQWEVVMFHMRARANLTVREHKAVLDFLKSAN